MNTEHSLRSIKGVGEKTELLLGRLGIRSTEDLLTYYPRDYDVYEPPVSIAALRVGKKQAVQAVLSQAVSVKRNGSRSVATVTIFEMQTGLTLTWFNMPFIRSVLERGGVYIFRGRIIEKQGRLVMEQPEYFTPAAYREMEQRLQPFYGLTAGLSNKTLMKAIRQLLNRETAQSEYLPATLRDHYQLAEYGESLEQIHFPKSFAALQKARTRLVFDEFLLFILTVASFKEQRGQSLPSIPLKPVWKTEELIEELPYTLTQAQKQVWHEIERDLGQNQPMARLVQGDVGSGKTIIAFLAMVQTAENDCQAALMVPTEVLARQHYEALRQLLGEEAWNIYQPQLLTGSLTQKEKRQRYEQIQSGRAKIIIGTHALIQEKVSYAKLALVITDEQHRFGVRQRELLSAKGQIPHVLVMSATPIPRTLAIILYGDLDISVIDELPARRLPIKNCVVDRSYREKAYRFIAAQLTEGRQAYIICPMVEASEELEVENVTDYPKKLKDYLPERMKVGILHGKMKPAEKNQVMEAFSSGTIQLLVSTTVVEVGVNVPNATVMLVENAERFGLAQLHQLRGRVGRGDAQSYCIFIQGNEDAHTSKRLDILNHSNDGFFIAGEDLKLRGPGDILGVRQSGDLEFRLADIYQDTAILKKAQEAAGMILSDDALTCDPQYQQLNKKLAAYRTYQTEGLSL